MQRKWVVSPDYRTVIGILKAARMDAGISQRDLAQRLGKHPSFINKIELIERRIDVLEFIAVVKALGLEPASLVQVVIEALPSNLEL